MSGAHSTDDREPRAEHVEEPVVLRISREHLRLRPPRLVFLKKREEADTAEPPPKDRRR
jgi:hypothetical protein